MIPLEGVADPMSVPAGEWMSMFGRPKPSALTVAIRIDLHAQANLQPVR